MSRREPTRRFATLLFTDIVGSTDIARELGDDRWRELVRRHHAIVRRELKRFDGHEVDTAGDGFFAFFDGPAAAIRCAVAVTEGVREVGLEVRAGLHVGEVVSSDGKAGGIAVNTAARVMSVAGFGEVLVSQTLRDVVAGSALGFEDHGVHTLKGIEGDWRLYRVATVDGERVAEPLDGAEAARRRLAIEPEAAPRSRRLALIGGGVLLALLAALAIVVATSGDEDEAPPGATGVTASGGPSPNSLVKVLVPTGEIEFIQPDLPGGSQSFTLHDLEVGLGNVWLFRYPTMTKVDRQDGSHAAVSGLEGVVLSGMAVGSEDVWAVGETLLAVDPATGHAGDPIEYIPIVEAEFATADVAEAFGKVWISSNTGRVIVIDPTTGAQESYEIGDTPERIVAGTDAMWVLDDFSGTVWRLDPRTADVVDEISLSSDQNEAAVGAGFVWVLDSGLGSLTPIAESDGAVREGISVGADALDVAFGLGSVWVASGGAILEIDPTTQQVVRTIEIGDIPIEDVAVDAEDGALWLALASGD